jgi:hypothetical protein
MSTAIRILSLRYCRGKFTGMKKLRDYFNSLTPEQRKQFCLEISMTEGSLRKALSVCRFGAHTAIRIERATHGAVTRAELRPDIFGDDAA